MALGDPENPRSPNTLFESFQVSGGSLDTNLVQSVEFSCLKRAGASLEIPRVSSECLQIHEVPLEILETSLEVSGASL